MRKVGVKESSGARGWVPASRGSGISVIRGEYLVGGATVPQPHGHLVLKSLYSDEVVR